MYSVSVIDNNVLFTVKQAMKMCENTKFVEHLFDCDEDSESRLSGIFKEKNGKYLLRFNEDFMEHIDFIHHFENEFKELKLKGDITFGSLDGKVSFWGYRFDGNGGMLKLIGKVAFTENA